MTMPEPRLMSGSEAAGYCGVTPATWSKWVAHGSMPRPVIGRRWDRKAIDLALDKLSGIEVASAPKGDPYLAWKAQEEGDAALEKWIREDAEKREGIPGNDYSRPRYKWEDDFDAAWTDHLAEFAGPYATKPAAEIEKLRQGLWNAWKAIKGDKPAPNKRGRPR
ncbi:helix-turn-helix transcriptional regulator [Bradyrhizobium sp. 1(2017)]|uniref:helix-turn-helix transcriptional regulator n=1 Tax=Bradyrhizobium sp. 1(2017) TaxID=1404888 RepID=UPI001AA0A7AB|nr:hypothetical protein [Bradyrhizobium sp. 1(2017)]